MGDYDKITYTLTTNVNDLEILKGGYTERIVVIPSGGTRTITGIKAPPPGESRILYLKNGSSTQYLQFAVESVLSQARNRFVDSASVDPNSIVQLFYEPAAERWFLVSGAAIGGSVTDHGALTGLSDDDHTQYVLAEPSSTDNRVVRWDGASGRELQTSLVEIDDSGSVTGVASLTANGVITLNNLIYPSSDGSADYVIITDGAGNLSFADPNSFSLDHGGLTGLSDDDHSQYMLAEPSSTDNRLVRWDGVSGRAVQTSTVVVNDSGDVSGVASLTATGVITLNSLVYPSADGSANYAIVTDGAGNLSFANLNSIGLDHGLLSGLADDDHAQYARLNGRSGGQSLYGGTAAGNSLRLRSTTNATLGFVIAYDPFWVRGAHSTGDSARLLFVDSEGATNQEYWQWDYDGTDLVLRTLNTSLVAGSTALSFARSGTALTGIALAGISYPLSDGSAGYVMTTDGANQLSLTDPDTLGLDHGSLTGLADDDHSAYVLAEPSSTDNRLVRWDGTNGRQIQTSTVTVDDGGNVTGVDDLTATGTIQGERFNISSTIPGIYFLEQAGGATSPPADESIWKLLTDGGDLYFQTRSDADVAGETALKLERTGTSVTGLIIGADTTNFQGNDITNVDDLTLSSTGPSINIIETDVSTDGGWWRWGTGNDDLVLTLRDDTGAYIEDAVAYRRTGGSLDYVEFPTAYLVTNRTDQEGVAAVGWGAGSVHNHSLGSTVTQIRATPTGYVLLTGITGGVQGRCVRLSNVATSTDAIIVIKGQNTGSSAANRIITHGDQDYFLQAGESVLLIYDDTTDRWRLFCTDGFHPQHYGFSFQTTTASNTNLLQIHAAQGYQYFGTVWLYSQNETSSESATGQWQKHEFCFGFPDNYTGVSGLEDSHEVLNGIPGATLATIGYSSSGSPSNLFTVYLTPNATPLNLRHTWRLELRIMEAAGYA